MQPVDRDRPRRREGPDVVLVYGDTNSTLAGAEAATTAGTPIAHVEAGLRSGDLEMPEERNRITVDRLADVLFSPDERSRETLEREGVAGRIYVVGDVMADATRSRRSARALRRPLAPGAGARRVRPGHDPPAGERRAAAPRRIVAGLGEVSDLVVLPAHPRTRASIEERDRSAGRRVRLIEPLSYLELASLASQARVIVTDSGGLQKEAYWYGVPCVTVRPSTEWVDTVELGANMLVDDDPRRWRSARSPLRRIALTERRAGPSSSTATALSGTRTRADRAGLFR